MDLFEDYRIACPYCASPNDIAVEPGSPSQEWIQDCEICCRPIVVRATSVNGLIENVEVRPENG